jgi:hypothetical protein
MHLITINLRFMETIKTTYFINARCLDIKTQRLRIKKVFKHELYAVKNGIKDHLIGIIYRDTSGNIVHVKEELTLCLTNIINQ